MSTININKNDVIWSYIGNILKLGINLILLPILLFFLSEEELGLWYVFASIGQIATLLDFGFAASLARNIAYVWCGATTLEKENISFQATGEINPHFFRLVLDTSKFIYWIISTIALVLLICVGIPYIKSLHVENTAIISWVIYSLGVFFNLLYSYYTTFLRGVGAIAENNKASIISKITQLVITVVLLISGFSLLGVSVAYLISGFMFRICSKIWFERYTNLKKLLSSVDDKTTLKECFSLFKIIWHNASKDGLVTISNYLCTQANTLICSSVLGLVTTGSYGLAIQISTIISTICGIPYSTFQPKLQEAAAKMDTAGSVSVMSTAMVFYMLAYIFLSCCLLIVLPFISIIKPTLNINNLMMITILIHMFIYQFYHLFASYISSFNILPYTRAFIISAILSVFLSYLLASFSNLGIWALIVSPIIVALCYNAWRWPIYALKMTNTSISEFISMGIANSIKIIKNQIDIQ